MTAELQRGQAVRDRLTGYLGVVENVEGDEALVRVPFPDGATVERFHVGRLDADERDLQGRARARINARHRDRA